ncbi:MAG: NAD-dependent deacylase [Chloroflexi bacterium]|nr:MAG: NAD-dependent deacylase [Chloroflexota bacterium]
MTSDDLIQEAAEIIRKSKNLAVLTGAGVSKESGVPTFRDALDGLWVQYDPAQLATRQAFQENPKLVWDWYQYRRGMVGEATPNPGHYALVVLEKRFPDMVIITQNVDDLHEQAGNTHIIHLHGNLAANKCVANCQGTPTPIDITQLEWDEDNGPPSCPYCGEHVRPDVVWFGEMLPTDALEKAIVRSEQCDVMLVVGTSGLVTPAANMPRYAQQSGAKIIEVNPDYTMISQIADVKLDGPSGQVLPKLVEALEADA